MSQAEALTRPHLSEPQRFKEEAVALERLQGGPGPWCLAVALS